jgi:NADPH2:quinone reductase
VGRLEDGKRVYFGIARSPFGSFCERALAASWMCLPLPEGIDDVTAAGIANPVMSSWAALTARAKFVAGESVLILGATGVAGRLAIQVAKRLGARRVVAAGRNPHALEQLKSLGADAVISLDQDQKALVSAFRSELAEAGVDVVLDYVWGQPAERVLEAISQKGLRKASPRVRFIQIGDGAGKTISLPAATLRSSGLELLGSGFGSASLDQILAALAEFFQAAAKEPFHFQTRAAPLRDVEALWNDAEEGTRLVFQP